MKKQTKETPRMATESDSVFQVVSQKSPNQLLDIHKTT